MSLHIKERFKESFLPALASRAGVDTLCKNARFRKSVSKQCKCHDTLLFAIWQAGQVSIHLRFLLCKNACWGAPKPAGDFWTPCPEVPLSAAPSLPLLGLILPPSGQVEKVVDVGLDRRRRPLRQGVIVGQPVLLEELERGGHLFQIVDFRPPLNLNSIINSY